MSLCIITLNEEKRLPACLDSAASIADEILVLDSGSADRTRAIARQYGAKVHTHPFDGFVKQKNRAVDLASGEWVLVIDADEVLTAELREEILAVVRGEQESRTAYRIPRISFYMGRWIRHSGWYPDYNIRLFRKGRGRFSGGRVHESVEVEGTTGTLRHPMEHYSYQNISQHMERINHYSTLIALDRFQRGERSSIFWAFGKAISKFLITYFYRLGFLDGRAGLAIAMMGSYYNFLKYAKLWELRMGHSGHSGNPGEDKKS